MIMTNEQAQDQGKQRRNGCRGNRVGIEYLQKLNVGGDDADEVALVPAFQLGGSQPPQGPEHFIPDQGQQFEGDKMVAGLLRIAQDAPGQGKHAHAGKDGTGLDAAVLPQQVQHRKAAENRDKRRCQVAQQTHDDCQKHIARQGPHQADKLGHDGKSVPLFHTAASFFSP